jgi:hypothetical protein
MSNVIFIVLFLFIFWMIVSIYNTIDTLHYVKEQQMTRNEFIGWRVVESSKSFLIFLFVSLPFLIYYLFFA